MAVVEIVDICSPTKEKPLVQTLTETQYKHLSMHIKAHFLLYNTLTPILKSTMNEEIKNEAKVVEWKGSRIKKAEERDCLIKQRKHIYSI